LLEIWRDTWVLAHNSYRFTDFPMPIWFLTIIEARGAPDVYSNSLYARWILAKGSAYRPIMDTTEISTIDNESRASVAVSNEKRGSPGCSRLGPDFPARCIAAEHRRLLALQLKPKCRISKYFSTGEL